MEGLRPITMKAVEIRWHWSETLQASAEAMGSNKPHGMKSNDECEGIMSIDFHPSLERICTAGLDESIKIWACPLDTLRRFISDDAFDVTRACEFVATLRKKDSACCQPNCARWSPSGNFVGSAHDNGVVRLWGRLEGTSLAWALSAVGNTDDETAFNKEDWRIVREFAVPGTDVRDIAFSPNSKYIASAAVSGDVTVHCVDTGVCVWTSDSSAKHAKECQGVVWDPWGRFVVSIGADKAMRSSSVNQPSASRGFRLSHTQVLVDDGDVKFHGEGTVPFFRRMGWSPDGTLLVVPAGVAPKSEPEERHCVYIFLRNDLARPAIRLTIKGRDAILGARWASCYFHPFPDDAESLHRKCKGSWGNPAYRMALALWTEDAVYVYTTDAAARFTHLTDLHLDSITDVVWAPNGEFLFVCAQDGYVTVVRFNEPLGEPLQSLLEIAPEGSPTALPTKMKEAMLGSSKTFEAALAQRLCAPKVTTEVRAKKKKKLEKAATVTNTDNTAQPNGPCEEQSIATAEQLAALLDTAATA